MKIKKQLTTVQKRNRLQRSIRKFGDPENKKKATLKQLLKT